MAAKKKNASKPTVPAEPPPKVNEFWVKSTGSKDLEIHLARVRELTSTIWLPGDLPEKERDRKVLAAVNMFSELKPQDGVEGMLATQMVATHSAAMECMRRAMLPEQSSEARDMNLRNANKLLQTYARQLEVLNKHRGKGLQKITVEHVTVEAGGQAIVGNVTSAPAAQPAQEGAAPMLAHQPAEFMPLIKDITPAKAPVKARRTGPGPTDPE